MAQAVIQRYTGVTATGALSTASAPGGSVFNRYAIQVKGTGAAPTSWSITVDGSLDGVNWTTIATHSSTDGSTVFAVDKPVLFIRGNVGSLVLGAATDVTVTVLAAE